MSDQAITKQGNLAVTLRLEMLDCHSNRETFLQLLLSHFMKYNLDLSLVEKLISFICALIFSTLHIGVVLLFSPWLQALNWGYLKEKNQQELGAGRDNIPTMKNENKPNTTQNVVNVTFVHIAVLELKGNLDDLHNSSDLNQ